VAEQARTEPGSIQSAIRWGLLLAAVATVGFRLPRLFGFFRNWREARRIGDTAALEGWRIFLYVDATGLLIVLTVGLAAFYFLRPRAKSAP